MYPVYLLVDAFLIAPFRLFPSAHVSFWLGCLLLALYCVLLGELCFLLVYRFNRGYYVGLNQKMARMHNISVEAIRYKNRGIFKDANWWANEYFGKVFFSQIALFAVSLWPVPFAMAWLQHRFFGIAIYTFWSMELGYSFVFIVSYILVRYLFSRVRCKVPVLKKLDEMRIEDGQKVGDITSWSELDSNDKES